MMCKKKKSIRVLFCFLMMFFIYCFCSNLSSEGMKNDSKATSQIDDEEQVAYLVDQNINDIFSANFSVDEEEKECSYTYAEQVAYLVDQNINDIFSANFSANEEEKECSYTYTEQVAYLIDQNINDISSVK